MSFQNKNKKEFENVYYKNKFNVYRIAMDYSGSHKESAEEIFQEVFLKLYTHFDTFYKKKKWVMDGRFWMHCTKKMKTGTKQLPWFTVWRENKKMWLNLWGSVSKH